MISNYMLFESTSRIFSGVGTAVKVVEVYLIKQNKRIIVPLDFDDASVLPSCGGIIKSNHSVEEEAKIRALKQVGVKIDEFHLLTQNPIRYPKKNADVYIGYSFMSGKALRSGFASVTKDGLISYFSDYMNNILSKSGNSDLVSFYKKKLQHLTELPA